MNKQWILYGVTGYTGKLIASMLNDFEIKPVIAGRSEAKVKQIAEKYQLKYLVFDLSNRKQLADILRPFDVVLNCAGPFSKTAKSMISACLHSETHYLDITGELAVFEHCRLLDEPAKKANIILCPGTGFDVVPTDCIAAALHQALPNATHLNLGFDSRSAISRGTMNTMIEGLSDGGRIRKAGVLEPVPLAYKTQSIDFGNGRKLATTIPWGDLETAYTTTSIPNIEVYIPMSLNKIKKIKRLNRFKRVLAWKWVQSWLLSRVKKMPAGPDQSNLESGVTYVWGEVSNESGEMHSAQLQTANGYKLTALASLEAVKRVLSEAISKDSGYFTPSQLFGSQFVTELPGSSEIKLEKLN